LRKIVINKIQDKNVTTAKTQNKGATENDKATWRAYFLVSVA